MTFYSNLKVLKFFDLSSDVRKPISERPTNPSFTNTHRKYRTATKTSLKTKSVILYTNCAQINLHKTGIVKERERAVQLVASKNDNSQITTISNHSRSGIDRTCINSDHSHLKAHKHSDSATVLIDHVAVSCLDLLSIGGDGRTTAHLLIGQCTVFCEF